MSPAVAAYREMPAADRLDFRVPSALKTDLSEAAKRNGQTTSEYVLEVLAEKVANDLAKSSEWYLTVPEQESFLRVLASTSAPTTAAKKAAERAAELFGTGSKRKQKK
jgi:uncharacterized protein (DUF1778 family)